jgi:hypothetical protein
MGSLNDDDESNDLPAVLSRIVSDLEKIRVLHGILGPFCHQSRNVLNCLKLSLYLSQRNDARSSESLWADLERRYLAVEQLFDRLQTICRPLSLSLIKLSLSLLINERQESWGELFATHQRSLKLIPPEFEDEGEYDPHWLGQALDQFVVWRASTGRAEQDALLRWWTEHGQFHLEWTETGIGSGGVTHEDRDHSGSLALPLLARVISAHGGVLTIVEPPGRHLRASWPQRAHLPQ